MIKILDATKSLTALVSDTSNGLGMIQPLDAFVTEELNGIYEAEIVVPQTDKHFNDLALNGLLKINAGEVIGEQIFRIYFISKPIDGKVLIKAQHISYDLNKIPVSPFTSTGAVPTKNQLLAHVVGTYPFDMMTDILNTTSVFSLDIPKTFRECLGGWEGSILDTFRCEYEWDNLLVKMLAHRGTDEGVRIAYGKNLTDFKQEENIENVYTSVLGYAVVNEQTYVGNVYHKIVSNMPKVLIVDFSNEYQDTAPTTEQLTQKAQDYATRNAIEVPNVSIDIKFVPLYQTEEYKNIAPLERVALGDTVHVFFEKMNVEATSRVVKTVWNVNLNRYDSIELGDTKANLTTLLDDAVQEAKQNITIDAGYIETELNDMSQLIINGLGLHRTLVPVATGGHRMYLHNKPTLAESDTQYMIGAGGFMISQDYGQTWNSGWDSSGNAVMNSLSTITLKALEIYGSYIQGSRIVFGDPSDPNAKYIEAAPYQMSGEDVGVSFDGTGYIRMQPQEQLIINNLLNGNVLNNFNMKSSSVYGEADIVLRNYDHLQNYILANAIELFESEKLSATSTTLLNKLVLSNYETQTGTSYLANRLQLDARSSSTNAALRNYMCQSSRTANIISLYSTNGNSNGLSIRNYDFASTNNNYGNDLYMVTTNSHNNVSMTNYWHNSSNEEITANRLYMFTDDEETLLYIMNRKSKDSSFANQIRLRGTPMTGGDTNTLEIMNYDTDSDRLSNGILLSKDTEENVIKIYSNRGGYELGNISMIKLWDNNFNINLRIHEQTIGGTQYKPCAIRLYSGNGNIYAEGTNFYWNGVQKW